MLKERQCEDPSGISCRVASAEPVCSAGVSPEGSGSANFGAANVTCSMSSGAGGECDENTVLRDLGVYRFRLHRSVSQRRAKSKPRATPPMPARSMRFALPFCKSRVTPLKHTVSSPLERRFW